jgi:hypothetical protein
MDIFKLAFETTVVGLLAFLWIALAAYLLFPALVTDLWNKQIPEYKNQTLLGVAALTTAYVLGSAILPISNQLVNDEHWPLTENAIRCQVLTHQEQLLNNIYYSALPKDDKKLSLDKLRPVHCSYWAPVFAPVRTAGLGEQQHIHIGKRIVKFLSLWVGMDDKPQENDEAAFLRCEKAPVQGVDCDQFKQKKILALFALEESAALNQGSDKTERLRQLHERIVVLRGAVFSGFALFFVCLCAYFAPETGDKQHRIRTWSGILLGLGFLAFALINGYRDLKNQNIFDTPVLEGLLAAITILGVILLWRGLETSEFHKKRYVMVALFLAGLAYGGWMWSEIIYDQEVLNSFAVLQINLAAPK